MPLVMGFLNNTCWFRYALLVDDSALKIVNGTGACLNTIYTVTYYVYSQRKMLIQVQVTIGRQTEYVATVSWSN